MNNPFDGLNKDEARIRYLELAKLSHPDTGGDDAAFVRLRAQYLSRLGEIGREVCKLCNGTRRAKVYAGFSSITMPCPNCRGGNS